MLAFNIFNSLLGLLQSFPLVTLFYEIFPINLKCMTYLLNDKTFLRSCWNGRKRIPICFAWEDRKCSFSMGKVHLSSFHHLCHIRFPEHLTSQLVLHVGLKIQEMLTWKRWWRYSKFMLTQLLYMRFSLARGALDVPSYHTNNCFLGPGMCLQFNIVLFSIRTSIDLIFPYSVFNLWLKYFSTFLVKYFGDIKYLCFNYIYTLFHQLSPRRKKWLTLSFILTRFCLFVFVCLKSLYFYFF